MLEKIQTQADTQKRIITASDELNNVLGGWIVEGGIILLSWEPWIGKSTLALQIAAWLKDKNIVYVSAEETASQIFYRAKRLGVAWEHISILTESNLENIMETLKWENIDLLILDSISVISSNEASGSAGSINQVKYIGEKLQHYVKNNNISLIIIGHITKDGNLAGPKSLEHLVDSVLFFEGERFEDIRLLRSLKNRFGTTGEVGIFRMEESGLKDIKNLWLELLSDKEMTPSIGSSISMTIEWNRPLLIECEALTNYTKFGYPKRSARGINTSKLDMLIAILSKYSKVKLESSDVYSNIARGLRIDEPWIDLAIIAAIISSKLSKPLPKNIIFIGEVSLTGKIKSVMHLEKRIKQAEKIGIEQAVIPETKWLKWEKIQLKEIHSIEEVVKFISEL